VAIAVFTAAVTSALTVRHLEGKVRGTTDLSSVRVGTVAGTAAEDTLTRLRVDYRKFATPQEGLRAIRNDDIDAFVYDKPLLAWLIRRDFASSLDMLDASVDVQNYAFAIPNDSPLRKTIDRAVADAVAGEWWKETTFRYLGSR
jgi:ABC-type amino acid transport substrate-binding protein